MEGACPKLYFKYVPVWQEPPGLGPWAEWCYDGPSQLHFGSTPLPSESSGESEVHGTLVA